VMFGNPEVTPGGRALKFWASVRIEMRRIETLKKGTEAFGARTRAKVMKNSVAPPFRQAEFDIIYGKGISRAGDLLDKGNELGIVGKTGAFYTLGDTKLGHGRDNARTFLEENLDLMDQIEAEIRSRVGIGGAAASDDEDKE
jgi:recombination protein RecA